MKIRRLKFLAQVLIFTLILIQFNGVAANAADVNLKDLTVKTVTIIETEPNFSINSAFYELEYGLLVKPKMMKKDGNADNMMAPLRDTFEKLPANYSFDKATGKVQISINDKILTMKVGEVKADVDGKALTAPYAPELIDNPGESGEAATSLYLPVKFVFEALDCKVAWEGSRKRLVATCLLTPRVGVKPLAIGGEWQHGGILNKDDSAYDSDTAKLVADNIVEFQNADGGWMKLDTNIDMTKSIKKNTHLLKSTIDNNATFTELEYLAKVYTKTKDKKYAESFIKGLNYLIDGQYDNGGWAQYFPDAPGYFKNITINDNAMVNILDLFMDILYKNDKNCSFVTDEYPQELAKLSGSFDKGVKCLLDLQVVVNGEKTAWASQYDKDTLKPAFGRAFELPSITSMESVTVVDFLMKIHNPSKEIIDAIQAAVTWMDKVKIEGKKVVSVSDYSREFGADKFLVDDPTSVMWARFYEIGTNKPIFSGRDSVKKYNMADISYERRNKYSWYNSEPQKLIEIRYQAWLKAMGIEK